MNLDNEQFAVTLLQSMSEAVVYADAEGRIQYWNAGAERIFGYAAADALGQSLDIIIPQSLRGRHWEGYGKTMQTGTTRYGAGDLLAVPAIRKDGSRISSEFTITPLPRSVGQDPWDRGDHAGCHKAFSRDEGAAPTRCRCLKLPELLTSWSERQACLRLSSCGAQVTRSCRVVE